MKRELETSIKDNWYSDLYPTWCDHFWYKLHNVAYRIGGMMLVKLIPSRNVPRTIEILLWRKPQVRYWL